MLSKAMSPHTPLLDSPPARVCILRLSAIGDVCHTLAVVRALQRAWPQTRFTWIIGSTEHKLMRLVPDVEFISYNKRGGFGALRSLAKELSGRPFDVLLHMQLSFRASLLSTLVSAPLRVGFDRAQARELQWLFTNARIPNGGDQHVLDALMGFAAAFGVEDLTARWDIPIPEDAHAYAARLIPDHRPTLLISPCSSHSARNWSAEGYAAVAGHASRAHGMRVILVGGPSTLERQMADAIQTLVREPLIDQVGKDTLPELLALLARATVLVTPDSGPAHMATTVGLPVIGLYGATRPARSGPYRSVSLCIDRYGDASQRYLGKAASDIPWATKIERPGVMALIDAADVNRRLDELMASGAHRR